MGRSRRMEEDMVDVEMEGILVISEVQYFGSDFRERERRKMKKKGLGFKEEEDDRLTIFMRNDNIL